MVHAYHHSKGRDRAKKIKEAAFAVGSPIIASALSTIGASAFLFGCRTWIFIELGLLICSITAMALLYTMTFLLAWLACAGPIPIFENDKNNLHQWDLKALCCMSCCLRANTTKSLTPSTVMELYQSDDNGDQCDDNRSVYSIEIVGDVETDLLAPQKPKTKHQAKAAKADGVGLTYDIEIINDVDNAPVPQPEEETEDQRVVTRPSVRSMLLDTKTATEVPEFV